MNAPAAITDPKVAGYAAQVLNFMPGCHGRELEMRARLLMARDTATAALTRCTDAEAGLMQEIQRLGTLYAYAGVSVEALESLLKAQRAMLRATGFLFQFAEALDGRD